MEETPNPQAPAHEALTSMRAMRGQGIRDHALTITAMAAEAWSVTVENLPGVTVQPAAGTGPAVVRVRFDGPAGGTGLAGRLVLLDGTMAQAAELAVSVTVWPPNQQSPSREDVKVPAVWPNDPDYRDLWDLWGFMPDATSHPGVTVGTPEAWEATPCPAGTRRADCVAEGQAGLAAGMSADRAWHKTTGQRSVSMAVLDSGMRWRNRDLREQVRLNAAELVACPPPGAMASQPETFDVNHDGFFNIRDYDLANLADWNNNGIRDGQDLIQGTLEGVACSNGVDEDGNAFVDDIAGWDFFWDDNDPSDDADFGHGNFEATLSNAQGNNGVDGIGVCPTCTFIPLRVGDTFIVDVNKYAAAVVYAVDNGISVVQQALGGLGNTSAMHQAVDYAYAANVPVVAAASDLNSYHHNWPAMSPHAFMVHAIVFDGVGGLGGMAARWNEANTFLNFNNCTNFGSKLMLSAPGTGCSSEATAKTAGQAALILSRWKELMAQHAATDAYYARPLRTEEVFQVLLTSADDIDVPGAETDQSALNLKKYPSNEGWDEHFGYGRNNAYRALQLLEDRAVPPEVDITTPSWFDVLRADGTAAVEVRGRVQNARTTGEVCFNLRWARGPAPSPADFAAHPVNSQCVGAGAQPVKTLGTIPLEALVPSDDPNLARSREARTITLELTATITGSNAPAAMARRAFFVDRDPTLKAGYPKWMGASGESSPRFVDVNRDGRQELVLATADGWLHVYTGATGELPGFPVRLINPAGGCGGGVFLHPEAPGVANGGVSRDVPAGVVSTPAIAPLEKDARPSIVIGNTAGALFVVEFDGTFRPGFPVCIDPAGVADTRAPRMAPNRNDRQELSFLSSPLVMDLEDNGVVDLVVGGGDGKMHVWLPDGTVKPGFPVALRHPAVPEDRVFRDRVVSSPVAADLDGDGAYEIVVGSNERFENQAQSALYAIWADGSRHPGGPFPLETYPGSPNLLWPQFVNMFTGEELLPTIGRGHPGTVAVADLDGDGKDEMITSGLGGTPAIYPEPRRNEGVTLDVSSERFGPLSNSQEPVVFTMMSSATIADINGDKKPDVVQGLVGLGIAGLVGQGGRRITFDHAVGAWDVGSGTFLDGFPAVVEDFQILMNYPVADVDGDGAAEVVVATAGYFIHAFRADGSSPEGWPKFTGGFLLATPALGDLDGDGLLEMAAVSRDGLLFVWALEGPANSVQWAGFKHDAAGTGNTRVAVTPPSQEPPVDCGCHNARAQPAGLWLLLVGLLGWRWRRKGQVHGG